MRFIVILALIHMYIAHISIQVRLVIEVSLRFDWSSSDSNVLTCSSGLITTNVVILIENLRMLNDHFNFVLIVLDGPS